MLVARSALSGIAGNYSGHPVRTRTVLEDAAGTARAVFISSVNLCLAVAAISRCQPGGVLGIELERWGSHGLVAIHGPSGRLPVWSVGVLWPTALAGFLPAVALDRARLRVSRFGQSGVGGVLSPLLTRLLSVGRRRPLVPGCRSRCLTIPERIGFGNRGALYARRESGASGRHERFSRVRDACVPGRVRV